MCAIGLYAVERTHGVQFVLTSRKLLNYKGEKLVEAKGVEPLSENVTGEETTYLVTFLRGRSPHVRHPH